jgi:hypothetical protein
MYYTALEETFKIILVTYTVGSIAYGIGKIGLKNLFD